MEKEFIFPCKVRYSIEGMKDLGKKNNRIGTAVRRSSRGMTIGCIVVTWDGAKGINYYHEDYIDVFAEQNKTPTLAGAPSNNPVLGLKKSYENCYI